MLQIALTPSANDIFTFHALVNGLVPYTSPLTASYFDLQQLNQSVLAGEPDVCKISIFTLGHILHDYVLLPTGCALGYGNGPKIVAKKPFSVDELPQKTMAIPGKDTTAYLLTNILLEKPRHEVFCPYAEVAELLASDQVDCALMIHESRFSIAARGWYEVADLGLLWEERTCFPLPLGGIVAKRSLGSEALVSLCQAIQNSLAFAHHNPQASRSMINAKNPDYDAASIDRYLKLYVNEESWYLSQKGREAISCLLTFGRSIGLLPLSEQDWLFDHPLLRHTDYPLTSN